MFLLIKSATYLYVPCTGNSFRPSPPAVAPIDPNDTDFMGKNWFYWWQCRPIDRAKRFEQSVWWVLYVLASGKWHTPIFAPNKKPVLISYSSNLFSCSTGRAVNHSILVRRDDGPQKERPMRCLSPGFYLFTFTLPLQGYLYPATHFFMFHICFFCFVHPSPYNKTFAKLLKW